MPTSTDPVRTLLAAAGVNPPDDEVDQLTRSYAIMRPQADALYLAELEPVAPAIDFDPRSATRGSAS